MEGKEEYIIEGARKIFIQKGIKALTMDQIAKELKVSKKTIYVFFRNREMLLNRTMEDYVLEERNEIQKIIENAQSPIQEFCEITGRKVALLRELNVKFYKELESYSKALNILNNHLWGFILKILTENIEKGQKLGIYHEDLNPELTARIHQTKALSYINPELFPPDKFSFADVVISDSSTFMRGICTEKGLKEMETLHCAFQAKIEQLAG